MCGVHVHEGELRHRRVLRQRLAGEEFLQLRRQRLRLIELHQQRGGIELGRLGLEPVQPREVWQVCAKLPRQQNHDVRDDGAHERQHEQAHLVAPRSPRFEVRQIHTANVSGAGSGRKVKFRVRSGAAVWRHRMQRGRGGSRFAPRLPHFALAPRHGAAASEDSTRHPVY